MANKGTLPGQCLGYPRQVIALFCLINFRSLLRNADIEIFNKIELAFLILCEVTSLMLEPNFVDDESPTSPNQPFESFALLS